MTTINEAIDAIFAAVKDLAPYAVDYLPLTVDGPTIAVFASRIEPSRTLKHFAIGKAFITVRAVVPLDEGRMGQRWLNDLASSEQIGAATRDLPGVFVRDVKRGYSEVGVQVFMDEYGLEVSL